MLKWTVSPQPGSGEGFNNNPSDEWETNMRRLAFNLLLWGLLSISLGGCAAAIIAGAAGAGVVASDDTAEMSVAGFFKALDDAISRKIYGIEKTKKDLGYKDRDGLVIRLMTSTLKPKQVGRGGTLTVTVRYALLGAPKAGAPVRLQQTLWQGKTKITPISDNRFERAEGTWEEVYTVPIPASAQPGSYQVGIRIRASGAASKDKAESEQRLAFDIKG